jgi:hypothetical protein
MPAPSGAVRRHDGDQNEENAHQHGPQRRAIGACAGDALVGAAWRTATSGRGDARRRRDLAADDGATLRRLSCGVTPT